MLGEIAWLIGDGDARTAVRKVGAAGLVLGALVEIGLHLAAEPVGEVAHQVVVASTHAQDGAR